MSEQVESPNQAIIPAGRRDMVQAAAANPLVSRGIADLAKICVPKASEANHLLSQHHVNLGSVWIFKKEYEKAITEYDEAIRHDPRSAGAYNLRGLAFWKKKEYAEAISDYTEAIRIVPEFAVFYNNRGNAWRDKKDFDKAILDFGHAIKLDPMYAEAFKNRGIAWWESEENDNAVKDFEEAIRLDPKVAAFHYIRGKIWLAKTDYDRAILDFDEAIRLDPLAEVFSSRAIARISKADFGKAMVDLVEAESRDSEKAEQYWSEAIACIEMMAPLNGEPMDERTATIYYFRGEARLTRKEYGGAIKDFDEAIRLDPRAEILGELAWLLATCPDENFRDGKRAILVATKAHAEADWGVRVYLDILAAAFAEAGQFDEAVRFQARVLEDPDCAGPFGDEYRRRLEMYKQKKPFREIS